MRALKFRAWDEKNKHMVYSTDEPVGDGESSLNYLFTQFDDNTFGFIPEGEGARLPTMQFTGLLDKNGKEIYEGDIVEYENGNAGYGRPRHEEISKDVIPSIMEYETFSDMAAMWKYGEVIGNIYEER